MAPPVFLRSTCTFSILHGFPTTSLIHPCGGAGRPAYSGWIKRALPDYRILLLDQRGTGLSTPVTSETFVARCGDDAEAGAAYLAHFRADSIVADAEAIRVVLAGKDATW